MFLNSKVRVFMGNNAENVAFNRCADFLYRMIEKYGAQVLEEIEAEQRNQAAHIQCEYRNGRGVNYGTSFSMPCKH